MTGTRRGGHTASTTALRSRTRPAHSRIETIRRYDNAHEETKGHELHVPQDPDPEPIEFPGMVKLWDRFWSEIPKTAFELE